MGPGLLMAGAAIGVSHLVQSTRAGADYGLQLLIIVILVNFFKYPFFEFGHRYAAATGENLLQGYLRMGKLYLYAFFLLNIVSAIISVAGVTIVTAGIADYIGGGQQGAVFWSGILLVISVGILVIGHYRWLDLSMKMMMAVLFVATVAAAATALWHGPEAVLSTAPSPWTKVGIGFIIALMGWMPAPVELSVWQSLWVQAQSRERGRPVTWREAKIDFNVGYALTIFMAVSFVMMGAYVMYGSGIVFSNSGAGFAAQLVELYQKVLGSWSKPVVALAAMAAMFSTVITCVDAYPRSLAVSLELLFPKLGQSPRTHHAIWMLVVSAAALVIIMSFASRLKSLIDLATTIAFLAAPFFAYLNYRLITSAHIPQNMRPHAALRILAVAGLVFLKLFGLAYIWVTWL